MELFGALNDWHSLSAHTLCACVWILTSWDGWYRPRGISPLAAAPMPGAVVSLAPEERAVILDRIKQEISASQKINEEAFAMLSSRLTALEATPAGARGVRSAVSNANVNPHADVRAHAPGEPLLAHPVCVLQCGTQQLILQPCSSALVRSFLADAIFHPSGTINSQPTCWFHLLRLMPDDAYKISQCGPGWNVVLPVGKSARTRGEGKFGA
jgi:hypothetical protein